MRLCANRSIIRTCNSVQYWRPLFDPALILFVGVVGGSVSQRSLCVCPGDGATFTCSVEEPGGGIFSWITNATSETCLASSSQPQTQCGDFIGLLENSSLSALIATSAATSDAGNILIQCYYITDLVGNATLLIAG